MDGQAIPPRKGIPLLRATGLHVRPLASLWRIAKYPTFVYVPAWLAIPTAAEAPQKDATLYTYIQVWE